MTNEEWNWEFRPAAAGAFDNLEKPIQERIATKLDEIVSNRWRALDEYIEPLSGVPHGKIRFGAYRLGVHADDERHTLVVYDIEHRSGAYDDDD